MCGISGFIDARSLTPDPADALRRMTDRLTARGPDASGTWTDAPHGAFLGHRRLSVIDISETGAQPMVSADERWVMVYNGELYNVDELRAPLDADGVRLRGSSDTEVLLENIARFGVAEVLPRTNGMFALAVWDRAEQTLYLARDRIGIKPLYYGECNNIFFFASELSAFAEHPLWRPTLDRESVALYLRYGYVPEPRGIWAESSKLLPGQWLTLAPGEAPRTESYWSLDEAARIARQDPWTDTPQASVEALDTLLRDAVNRQMVSDVPLGAFLSGGIDSSTVVALMQAQSSRPVQTFSIGFDEAGYNEAEHASRVAAHLGTDHHELYVTPDQALAVLPEVSRLYDEPFADSSQIPTFLVSRLARESVTVSLSGDGGDECFAGYSRYALGQRLWHEVNRVPRWIRRSGAGLVETISEDSWDSLSRLLPARLRPAALGMRAHRLARRMRSSTATEIYGSLMSQWHAPNDVIASGREPLSLQRDPSLEQRLPDMLDRMQFIDTLTYLPGDILTKVDRASMGVSLECRVPLLDHRVVEFAWRLSPALRQHDGGGKWPLREVLYRYVPRELVDRPKMGFGVPLNAWLRGPLKEWAWSLLSPAAIEALGVVRSGPVEAAWNMHQSGQEDLHYPLWVVLMLQDWLQRNGASA